MKLRSKKPMRLGSIIGGKMMKIIGNPNYDHADDHEKM